MTSRTWNSVPAAVSARYPRWPLHDGICRAALAALERITGAADVSIILILSDINMPGMSGLELLPKAKAMRPDVPIIMITAYGYVVPSRRRWRTGPRHF